MGVPQTCRPKRGPCRPLLTHLEVPMVIHGKGQALVPEAGLELVAGGAWAPQAKSSVQLTPQAPQCQVRRAVGIHLGQQQEYPCL